MKYFNSLFLLVALSIFAISCDDDEPTVTPDDTVQDTYKYDGDWEGTYDGDDTGTISITIDNNGKLTGTGYSNSTSANFQITGTVSEEGVFENTTTSIGTDFIGTMGELYASGTYHNKGTGITGGWTAAKQ